MIQNDELNQIVDSMSENVYTFSQSFFIWCLVRGESIESSFPWMNDLGKLKPISTALVIYSNFVWEIQSNDWLTHSFDDNIYYERVV